MPILSGGGRGTPVPGPDWGTPPAIGLTGVPHRKDLAPEYPPEKDMESETGVSPCEQTHTCKKITSPNPWDAGGKKC